MQKMKFWTVTILMGLLMTSCAQYKNTQGTRRVGREMKGEWILSSVTYNRQGKYEVALLNDTSMECFTSSKWNISPNNYRGTYEITKNGCAQGTRYFMFVIDEVNKNSGYYDFLLKPTNEKYKSETNAGIRMHLSQLSEDKMVWEHALILKDGKPFVIKMNFVKSQM